MSAASDLRPALLEGLAALGLALPADGVERLLGYVTLLARWSTAYNLTAVRDPAQMVPRHLFDSLAILPWVRGPRLADVGTGAGLPGIPLAIAAPELRVVLLDANGKKVRFCRQAVQALGLANVEVVQARVEAYRPAAGFATVAARAVSALPALYAAAGHLLAPDGVLLAMKGVLPEAEVAALRARGLAVAAHRLRIPGITGERHLIVISGSDPL